MRVSKFIHSCLLIEEGGDRLLIDPGSFTLLEKKVAVEAFDGTRSVLVTHSHPDHMDPDLLRKIVDRNQAVVYANEEIVGKLKEKGVPATEFGSGTRKIGSFEITAIPSPHEAILSATLPANTAYIINDRLLHPGDSYSAELRKFRGLPLVALPITAPWTTEIGTAAFADDLAPKRILPIHDGYVKSFFLASRHQALGQHFADRGIAYAPADEPGSSIEV